jgi:hypothetical protein
VNQERNLSNEHDPTARCAVTATALSAPGSKSGRLQRALLGLLREHKASGALPTSGRFLWYELEQRGIVDKTRARGHPGVRRGIDQDVSDALTRLREDGLIPWSAIVDETRTLEVPNYAATVLGWHRQAAETEAERIGRWDGGPPPLILCESRSLAGVLRPIAYRYTAPVAATNGQAGGFLHTEIGPLLRGGGRRVLYLGDLDLAGGQIEANTGQVLYRGTAPAWPGNGWRSPGRRPTPTTCAGSPSSSVTGGTRTAGRTRRSRPRPCPSRC